MKENDRIPEKSEIEQALISLEEIYSGWGLRQKDWVVVDEIAYFLQGYEVIAKEIEERHLDTYVNIEKLPWKASNERSVIPPRDSAPFKDHCRFMETTGFGLDILATTSSDTILQQPTVDYELPNGKKVLLMEATSMTRQFWQKTLMHYSPTEVGPEKVEEWMAKLELIRKAALEKGKTQLAEECQEMLVKARGRWVGVFGSQG